jgi:hypothetical protein
MAWGKELKTAPESIFGDKTVKNLRNFGGKMTAYQHTKHRIRSALRHSFDILTLAECLAFDTLFLAYLSRIHRRYVGCSA